MNRVKLEAENFCIRTDDCNATRRTLCGWISLIYENQEKETDAWSITAREVSMRIEGAGEYDSLDDAIEDSGMSATEVTEIYNSIMDILYGIAVIRPDGQRNEYSLQADGFWGNNSDEERSAAAG